MEALATEWSTDATTYIVRFPVIQKVPQVDYDCNANRDDSQNTVDFGRPRASHENTSCEHPRPPIEGELAEVLISHR